MVKGLCCRTFVKNDNSHISKIRTSEIIQIDKVCLRKIEALTCSWPKLGKLASDTGHSGSPPRLKGRLNGGRTSHIFPVLGFNIHSSSYTMRASQRKWTQCLPLRWESMRCGGGGKVDCHWLAPRWRWIKEWRGGIEEQSERVWCAGREKSQNLWSRVKKVGLNKMKQLVVGEEEWMGEI